MTGGAGPVAERLPGPRPHSELAELSPMVGAAIVVTRNSITTIDQCLAPLVAAKAAGYLSDVVVVDGSSTDGTREVAASADVVLVDETPPRGMSGYFAKDFGWRVVEADFYLFLDADATMDPEAFDQIRAAFFDRRVGAVGVLARIWHTDTPVQRALGEWWTYYAEHIRGLAGVSSRRRWTFLLRRGAHGAKLTPSGPCFAVRADVMRSVDGFRVGRRLEGGDIGLSLKIIASGYETKVITNQLVAHDAPRNLDELWQQRFRYGYEGAIVAWRTHRGWVILRSIGWIVALIPFGAVLAARFRNWRHLPLFALSQVATLCGFVRGLSDRPRRLPELDADLREQESSESES